MTTLGYFIAGGDYQIVFNNPATEVLAGRLPGVPHTAICGGQGRCTTCRVHVRGAPGALPQPTSAELQILRRIGSPLNVRLACQLRPQGPVEVAPVLPVFALRREPHRRQMYGQGGERQSRFCSPTSARKFFRPVRCVVARFRPPRLKRVIA
jgi:ferredoxin